MRNRDRFMQIFKAGCLKRGIGTHLFCGRSPANIYANTCQQYPTTLFKQNARHLLRLVAWAAHHKVVGPFKTYLPAIQCKSLGKQHAHGGRCGRAVKGGSQWQAQGRIQVAHRRMPLPPELPTPGCLAVDLHTVPRLKPAASGKVCSSVEARFYLSKPPDLWNKIFASASGCASLGLVAVAY